MRSVRSTLLALLLLAAPFGVHAQLAPAANDTLSLSLFPEYPRPYEEVTVTVKSSSINLATADIQISFNGAVVEEGQRSAVIRMGGPGTKNTIRAVAATPSTTLSKEVTLIPAEVSLVLEADSTAHPFYEGARLVPSEARIRLIAVADLRTAPGTKLAGKDVVYQWEVDGRILESESGLGRAVLAASAPPRYRDVEVSVTASSRDQTIVAYASTAISPIDPYVRIYQSDPLSGTNFAFAITDSLSIPSGEEAFRAVPYFFKDVPSLSWNLNGNKSGVTDDITVRSSGGAGTGVLSVRAEDAESSVSESVTLRFTAERRDTFFGL